MFHKKTPIKRFLKRVYAVFPPLWLIPFFVFARGMKMLIFRDAKVSEFSLMKMHEVSIAKVYTFAWQTCTHLHGESVHVRLYALEYCEIHTLA